MDLLSALGISLLMTLALELGFALLFGVRGAKDLALVALANAATNPPVVLLNYLLLGFVPPVLLKAALEALAVAAEWLIFKDRLNIKRPFLFSLSANLFSFGIGLIINQFI